MEKKSLGRGLEDIADIFISQSKNAIPPDDSPSENLRGVVGESRPGDSVATSEGSRSFSEDDIITVIDERLKVNRNCRNAKPSSEQHLSGRDEGLRAGNMENTPGDCEITEYVTSKKKLGYYNTPDVQQNIVNSLNQHLRRNYSIQRVELVKVHQVSCPGIKNRVEENISIYIKEK